MSDASATIRQLDKIGMVTIRGDLGDPQFCDATSAAIGLEIPAARKVVGTPDTALAWMSTDELLAFTPDASSLVERLEDALSAHHHLAIDVSGMRVIFEVQGAGWRDVIARGAPVDLHQDAFGPGDFRRTRLGQIAAAIWCFEPDVAHVTVARSVSAFAADWLAVAAGPSMAARVL